MVEKGRLRAALAMVAVLVTPLLVGLTLGRLRSPFSLLIFVWWQPLVVPYTTTYAGQGQPVAHPLLIATLQWAAVTGAFVFLAARLRAWQQLLAAIAAVVLVGILSHAIIESVGLHFDFDAP
jgi:hypothetical protein